MMICNSSYCLITSDLQKDILDLMDFEPIMKDVKPMDAKLFDPALMGLKEIIEAK